jgi:hypothetical protein
MGFLLAGLPAHAQGAQRGAPCGAPSLRGCANTEVRRGALVQKTRDANHNKKPSELASGVMKKLLFHSIGALNLPS